MLQQHFHTYVPQIKALNNATVQQLHFGKWYVQLSMKLSQSFDAGDEATIAYIGT